METRHIVTIDLGTSKTTLTVAEVNGENVQVIYFRKVPSEGIRYSYVFNSRQVADTVSALVAEAEKDLQIKIRSAVVGMPRWSITKETAQANFDISPEECIDEEDVNALKQDALESYPLDDPENDELYGAIAQSFSNGDEIGLTEDDIIGVSSDKLSGDFNLFIGKKRRLSSIDVAFKRTGINVAMKVFTPEPTGKAVLTKGEMDNGVALIDLGGGVTTVSVYYRNILRHYASIPFGGKSVTNDIKTECMIPEDMAEKIKTGYGGCMPDKLQTLSEKILQIRSNSDSNDIQIPVKYLSEIITARMKEIFEAVLYEIQASGFADNLRSGAVLIGGGAKLLNCGNWFKELSGYDAKTGIPRMLFSTGDDKEFYECDNVVSAGLLLAAKNSGIADCYTDVRDAQDEKTTEAETAGQKALGDGENGATAEANYRHETSEASDTRTAGSEEDNGGTVFDMTPEQKSAEEKKEKEKAQSQKKQTQKKSRIHISDWTKGVGKLFNDIFDDFGKESV